MKKRAVVLMVLWSLTGVGQAFADTRQPRQAPRAAASHSKRSKLMGLVLGAGAGVAGGLAAAFATLPDASCTNGKTWVAAGSFGSIGAALGYRLAGRGESKPAIAKRSPGNATSSRRSEPSAVTFDDGTALRLPAGVRSGVTR